MGDRDDWASDVSERDIGLRDLELVEAQLATDGYREGIAFGRKLGMQYWTASAQNAMCTMRE